METPIARIARWFANRNARCLECGCQASDRFCSDACAREYADSAAY